MAKKKRPEEKCMWCGEFPCECDFEVDEDPDPMDPGPDLWS